MVNRIWQHLFGRDCDQRVDNFGVTGDMPSHPELLDHLARRFMHDGWSVKKLVRALVLTPGLPAQPAAPGEHSPSIRPTGWSGGTVRAGSTPRKSATPCWPWPASSIVAPRRFARRQTCKVIELANNGPRHDRMQRRGRSQPSPQRLSAAAARADAHIAGSFRFRRTGHGHRQPRYDDRRSHRPFSAQRSVRAASAGLAERCSPRERCDAERIDSGLSAHVRPCGPRNRDLQAAGIISPLTQPLRARPNDAPRTASRRSRPRPRTAAPHQSQSAGEFRPKRCAELGQSEARSSCADAGPAPRSCCQALPSNSRAAPQARRPSIRHGGASPSLCQALLSVGRVSLPPLMLGSIRQRSEQCPVLRFPGCLRILFSPADKRSKARAAVSVWSRSPGSWVKRPRARCDSPASRVHRPAHRWPPKPPHLPVKAKRIIFLLHGRGHVADGYLGIQAAAPGR